MSTEKCFCHVRDKQGNRYQVKDAEARQRLTAIEEQVGNHQTNISQLSDYLSDAERNITEHEEKITALEGDVTDHEDRLKALEESAESGAESGGNKLYRHTGWNGLSTTINEKLYYFYAFYVYYSHSTDAPLLTEVFDKNCITSMCVVDSNKIPCGISCGYKRSGTNFISYYYFIDGEIFHSSTNLNVSSSNNVCEEVI